MKKKLEKAKNVRETCKKERERQREDGTWISEKGRGGEYVRKEMR